MRRLLTGYAVTFNLRHRRSGHLFQNRYKSIVCDEEQYLLGLVRYIHLNPLRAGLVKTVDELERYAWSGHAVLMGEGALPGQATVEVLGRFGKSISTSRQRSRTRAQRVASARSLICHIAFACGYRGVDIARRLGSTGSGVTIAARRGRQMIAEHPDLLAMFEGRVS